MDGLRRLAGMAAAVFALAFVPARGQEPVAAGERGPTLTLGTAVLRGEGQREGAAFGKWPDVRLRLEQPGEITLSPEDLDPRVRSLEVRLPASFFWVGYEWPADGENRATFSIQRRF